MCFTEEELKPMTDDDDKENYRCVFTEEELKPMTDDDDKEEL